MTAAPRTLNRPQVIALYALAMELGPATEFAVLTTYTVGSLLVEARFTILGPDGPIDATCQYTLPVEGGSKKVGP